jgi:2-dehydropantoate 2-reductase
MVRFSPWTAGEVISADVRVVVIGAGAIGGTLAGHLAGAGHDVVAADGWVDHVAAIRERGLRVEGVRGEKLFALHAVTYDQLGQIQGPFDVAFVCVKSYETDHAASLLSPMVTSETTVVSTQNGLNEERLAGIFKADMVVGAVTEMGGSLPEPGLVVETRKDGGFLVGEMDGRRTERINRLARLMSDCAPTHVSDNITGVLWSKLLWNCMLNAGSAVTGMGQGRMVVDDMIRTQLIAVGREVARVAVAAEVRLEPLILMGVDPGAICSDDVSVATRAEQAVIELYRSQLDKVTSMLQDIRKGRRTEIDQLNGYVVAKATVLGLEVPLNAALVQLVHEIEAGRLLSDPNNIKELANWRTTVDS